jgi:hypothetical protein
MAYGSFLEGTVKERSHKRKATSRKLFGPLTSISPFYLPKVARKS